MEAVLEKYFWVIKALGLAIATGLAASALTTHVGTKWVLDVEEAPVETLGEGEEGKGEGGGGVGSMLGGLNPFSGSTSKSKRMVDPGPDKRRVAEQIRERNIFCPTCVPEDDEVQYDEQGRPVGTVANPGETKSSLPLRLMATMESSEPKYSLATIFDEESEIAGVYGPGDVIRPGVLVMSVERGIVHLRNDASLEYLELGGEGDKRSSARTNKPKRRKAERKKRRRSKRYVEGSEDAIDCPNENLCVVEREFVEKLMANPALLSRQARVIPAMKDGETRGFKFYGIRRDSLPRLIGLKNGDMLTSVNGEELTSVDKAMTLYTKLRHAQNLSFTVERRGKSIDKEIQIK